MEKENQCKIRNSVKKKKNKKKKNKREIIYNFVKVLMEA